MSLAPVCEAATLASMQPPWYPAPPVDHREFTHCSLGSCRNALQSGRSRDDLRMTSRAWQCLSQPTPTATCPVPETQRHAACSRTTLPRGGSVHSGGGYTYRKKAVLYLCTMATMWGAEEGHLGHNRFLVVSCLIAEALIDKLQHESTSRHLSLKKTRPIILCIANYTGMTVRSKNFPKWHLSSWHSFVKSS